MNLTPTWAGVLPALVHLASQNKDDEGREYAWSQLRRMAVACDEMNERERLEDRNE